MAEPVAIASKGIFDVTALLPPGASDALKALAADLSADPDGELPRERLARALMAEGAAPAAARLLEKWKHLNKHDKKGLPCLCKRCIDAAPKHTEASGITFARDFVLKKGRLLHFWAPAEILPLPDTHTSVRAALSRQLTELAQQRKQRARLNTIERERARAAARARKKSRAR